MKASLEHLCKSNISLAPFSTYAIGGEARFVAMPQTTEQLVELMENVKSSGLNPVFFGMGSNILFPDQPHPDTLFLSLREHIEIRYKSIDELYVSAGTPMAMLSLLGIQAGISDFGFTFLLPGTFGGGVYMNAKYFSNQINELLTLVYYIDVDHLERGIQSIDVADCKFAYKHSIFMEHNWFIIGADLKLKSPIVHEDRLLQFISQAHKTAFTASDLGQFADYYVKQLEILEQRGEAHTEAMRAVINDRMGKHHFDYPSCGSVFKNNYNIGEPIGKLADRLNLRGTQRGQAMISPVHGNVIQNRGGAKAQDVIELIKLVQDAISGEFGFVPECELVIV